MEHAAEGLDALGALGPLLTALQASAFGVAARQSAWLYPAASVAHILGVALLVGTIVAFDLRVLGLAQPVPLRAAARLLLPLARLGFLVQVASGSVMLAADATHLATNPAFQAKLVLVVIALLNVALFHLLAGRGLTRLEPAPSAPLRMAALVSLVGWIAVAGLGRFIAYV